MKKETKNSKIKDETISQDKVSTTPIEKEKSNIVVETPIETPAQKKAKEKEGKVGLLLKEVRSKQGKTIPEISQELCIRKVYLTAIEESDYDNIPEYPYGIGFIRSYADYLGLDGVNIVQMYKEEAEENFRKNNPYFVSEPQVEATVPSKKYLMISLLAIIAIYFVWTMYNKMNDETPIDDVVVEEAISSENQSSGDASVDYPLKVEDFSISSENSVAEENVVVIDAVNAENNNPQVTVKEGSFVAAVTDDKLEETPAVEVKPAEVEENTVAENKSLVLKIKKDTWVEVKNDQKLYLSKVLQPGDTYTVPNDANLRISVGKAEGVEVLYDGKTAYTISPNKKMNISVNEILAQANH